MSSISDGTTTLQPLLILGWSDERASGNIVHEIIGTSEPYVTLHPARTRTGTLQILNANMAAADLMLELLARAAVLTLDNTELPGTNMRFVVTDTITRALDDQTLVRVVLSVPFRRVT